MEEERNQKAESNQQQEEDTISKQQFSMQAINKYIKKSKYQRRKERKALIQKQDSGLKQELSEIRHGNKDFICPICLQYICCSTSVKCGHTFCEMCFAEYQLLFQQCLVCSANIQNQEQRSCFLLDNLIQEFIERNHQSELESYKNRKQSCNLWRQKKVITEWAIGQKIDIRDSNNIWCVGIISRIQPNKNNQAQNVVVCYINNLSIQEELPCASQRLSPYGFFTSRKDILHYDNSLNSSSSSSIVIEFANGNDSKPQKLYIS